MILGAVNSMCRLIGLIIFCSLFVFGAVGCEAKPCEVLVINGASSLGMAQRYEVALVDRLNLVRSTADENSHAWRVVIRETRFEYWAGDIEDGSVDYRVISPGLEASGGWCKAGFESCFKEIVNRLPDQCRIRK